MNISPINSITKRALPLVATAAIGLGTLASCSSENNNEEYQTYKEDIVMLDNKLDSLKQVKSEGKISFPEYYSKSKEVIEQTTFNKSSKPTPAAPLIGLSALSIGIGLLGFAINGLTKFFSNNSSEKRIMMSTAFMLGGAITALLSGFVEHIYSTPHSEKVEQYKTQKTKELNQEKFQYLESKDLQFKEEFELLNK